MIQQAIQEVQALALRTVDKPTTETIAYPGGKSFTHRVEPTEHGRKLGAVIEPFRPAKLEVSTLTGFVDAIKAGVAGNTEPTGRVIHVEDYLTVALKNSTCDDFGKRDTLLTAKHQPIDAFKFEAWYEPSRFIIALQVAFHLNDGDGTYLLRLASNLTAGSEVNMADDGINQTVKLKAGEVKTAEHNLKPRVKLLPKTTFDEVAPVEREFLIRLKQSPEQIPTIALFAVDGTKWQGENMIAIKSWLSKQLTGWQILA